MGRTRILFSEARYGRITAAHNQARRLARARREFPKLPAAVLARGDAGFQHGNQMPESRAVSPGELMLVRKDASQVRC